MKKREKGNLSEWLDQLQRDSWQLELIVSAFAIFLLLAAANALEDNQFLAVVNEAGLDQEEEILQLGFVILSFSLLLTIVNLVIHVLLRCIWIGAIGLRSVSGDINFLALRLSPRFEDFLRKRIGRFDDYILRLETICSVVFAFTFLIVFMLIGVALYFGLFLTALPFIGARLADWMGNETAEVITIPIVLVFLLLSLLYLIDFISLGRLKRIRWLSVVYYPVYRFFSLITLATLYRPLYYNLVDNKFGRRVAYFLVPYVLTVILLFSLNIESYGWYPDEPGKVMLNGGYYDDLRGENERIEAVSIPSKYVKNGFLEVFLQYRPTNDDVLLEKVCPDFKPFRESGLSTNVFFSISGKSDDPRLEAADTALFCMSKLYKIEVDNSTFHHAVFRFYMHPNQGERGLLTVIDVNSLSRGPHELKVKKLKKEIILMEGDTMHAESIISIPFWKE